MSVDITGNPSRPKLEPVPQIHAADLPPPRQNLADTAMAGHTTRDPARRRSTTLDPTPETEDPRASQLTPVPLGASTSDSWFLRTGAIPPRRTMWDDEDPPQVNAWTYGKTPLVLAAAGGVLSLAIISWLVFA